MFGHEIYFDDQQEIFKELKAIQKLIELACAVTLDSEHFGRRAEISVVFTDNEGIRELNRLYREKDSATDVLSFPIYEKEELPLQTEEPVMLGDVVLSLERALQQAEEYGHSFEREVAFLTVHSMLHLLGYDHETGEEDRLAMRAREEAILADVGQRRE